LLHVPAVKASFENTVFRNKRFAYRPGSPLGGCRRLSRISLTAIGNGCDCGSVNGHTQLLLGAVVDASAGCNAVSLIPYRCATSDLT
jgi:hypothetical protein